MMEMIVSLIDPLKTIKWEKERENREHAEDVCVDEEEDEELVVSNRNTVVHPRTWVWESFKQSNQIKTNKNSLTMVIYS